jgi:hypothetical protein
MWHLHLKSQWDKRVEIGRGGLYLVTHNTTHLCHVSDLVRTTKSTSSLHYASFKAFEAAYLRGSFCWNMTTSMGNQIPTFRGNIMPSSSRVDRSMKNALRSIKNSGSNYPLTECHIQERPTRLHCCEHHKNRISIIFLVNKMGFWLPRT